MSLTSIPVTKIIALNERDYGDLSGLNKDDARKKWGEEQVLKWRRSYDIQPPGGESLKDTIARTLPYYVQEILPGVLRGKRTLISAHGNSLRALIMVLEKHTPESIIKRELETGVPIIYRLNADSTVASKLDLGGLTAKSGVVSSGRRRVLRCSVPRSARSQNAPSLRGRENSRSADGGRATPATAARCRIPHASRRSSRTHSGLNDQLRLLAAMADAPHLQFRRRHRDFLEGGGAGVIDPERPVQQQHVEAEEAEHRPCPDHQEGDAGGEADGAHRGQQHVKPVGPSERCGDRCAENSVGSSFAWLPSAMVGNYSSIMAKKPPPKSAKSPKSPPKKAASKNAMRRVAARKAAARRRALDRSRDRRGLHPLPQGQSGAEGRARASQQFHAAGRGGDVGAGDGCGRQQGDARAVSGRRHAGEDGRARRGEAARRASRPSGSIAPRRRTSSHCRGG